MDKNIKSGVNKTRIVRKAEQKGESLEEMIRRSTANNEPIDSTAPMIYTEKAKGVLAETDIRTDKMDLALDAIDKFQKSEIARNQANEQANEAAQTTGEVSGNKSE